MICVRKKLLKSLKFNLFRKNLQLQLSNLITTCIQTKNCCWRFNVILTESTPLCGNSSMNIPPNFSVYAPHKKVLGVWNNMKVSKWSRNIYSCVNYCFNNMEYYSMIKHFWYWPRCGYGEHLCCAVQYFFEFFSLRSPIRPPCLNCLSFPLWKASYTP